MPDFAYDAFKTLVVGDAGRNAVSNINDAQIRQFGSYSRTNVSHLTDEQLHRKAYDLNTSPDLRQAVNAELRERGTTKGITAGIAMGGAILGTSMSATATKVAVENTIPKVNVAPTTITGTPTQGISQPPVTQGQKAWTPPVTGTSPTRIYPQPPRNNTANNSGYSTPYVKPEPTLNPIPAKPYQPVPNSQRSPTIVMNLNGSNRGAINNQTSQGVNINLRTNQQLIKNPPDYNPPVKILQRQTPANSNLNVNLNRTGRSTGNTINQRLNIARNNLNRNMSGNSTDRSLQQIIQQTKKAGTSLITNIARNFGRKNNSQGGFINLGGNGNTQQITQTLKRTGQMGGSSSQSMGGSMGGSGFSRTLGSNISLLLGNQFANFGSAMGQMFSGGSMRGGSQSQGSGSQSQRSNSSGHNGGMSVPVQKGQTGSYHQSFTLNGSGYLRIYRDVIWYQYNFLTKKWEFHSQVSYWLQVYVQFYSGSSFSVTTSKCGPKYWSYNSAPTARDADQMNLQITGLNGAVVVTPGWGTTYTNGGSNPVGGYGGINAVTVGYTFKSNPVVPPSGPPLLSQSQGMAQQTNGQGFPPLTQQQKQGLGLGQKPPINTHGTKLGGGLAIGRATPPIGSTSGGSNPPLIPPSSSGNNNPPLTPPQGSMGSNSQQSTSAPPLAPPIAPPPVAPPPLNQNNSSGQSRGRNNGRGQAPPLFPPLFNGGSHGGNNNNANSQQNSFNQSNPNQGLSLAPLAPPTQLLPVSPLPLTNTNNGTTNRNGASTNTNNRNGRTNTSSNGGGTSNNGNNGTNDDPSPNIENAIQNGVNETNQTLPPIAPPIAPPILTSTDPPQITPVTDPLAPPIIPDRPNPNIPPPIIPPIITVGNPDNPDNPSDIPITINLPINTGVNDIITITTDSGSNIITTITEDDITQGTLDLDLPLNNQTEITVNVTITSPGNDLKLDTDITIDTENLTPEAPIEVTPIINPIEEEDEKEKTKRKLDILITLPPTINIGDSVIITINNSNNGTEAIPDTQLIITVTDENVISGVITVTYPLTNNSATVTVTIAIINAIGNSSIPTVIIITVPEIEEETEVIVNPDPFGNTPTTTGALPPTAPLPPGNNVIPFPVPPGSPIELNPDGTPATKPTEETVTQTDAPTQCQVMSNCIAPTINNALGNIKTGCDWKTDRATVIGNQSKVMGTQTKHSVQLAGANTLLATVSNVQLMGIQGTLGGMSASITAGFTAVQGQITTLSGAMVARFGALTTLVTEGFTAVATQVANFAKSIYLDKVLNLLTFILSLHNALQLSKSLATSIGELMNSVFARFGLKDEEGQALDITEVIGDTVENVFKNIVGQELYTSVTRAWAKGSAIWTSTVNIVDLTRNMFEGTQNLVEIGAQTTGKIGNALKRAGVVFEDSFDWFDEKINARTGWFKKFKDFTEGIQEPVDTLQEITETIGEIGENWNEIKGEVDTIKTKTAENIEEIKTKEDQIKITSQSASIADTDFNKPDN